MLFAKRRFRPMLFAFTEAICNFARGLRTGASFWKMFTTAVAPQRDRPIVESAAGSAATTAANLKVSQSLPKWSGRGKLETSQLQRIPVLAQVACEGHPFRRLGEQGRLRLRKKKKETKKKKEKKTKKKKRIHPS